jgi:hypothetical protein
MLDLLNTNPKILTPRQWRTVVYLGKFQIKWPVIEGKKNILVDLLSRIAERSTYQGGLPYLEEDDAYLGAIQLGHGKTPLETPLLKKRTKATVAPKPAAEPDTGGYCINTSNTSRTRTRTSFVNTDFADRFTVADRNKCPRRCTISGIRTIALRIQRCDCGTLQGRRSMFSPFQIMFGIERKFMLQTYRARLIEGISPIEHVGLMSWIFSAGERGNG